MTIQFNTDKNGNEEFTAHYVTQIEDELSKYSNRITRIEVHLSDEDGNKNGLNSMRCMIEARLEGLQPVAVTNQADTHDQAVSGAIDKLATSLHTIIGKRSNH